MKSDYESKHSEPAKRKANSAGNSRSGSSHAADKQTSRSARPSQGKKQRKGSGAVISIALFLIIASLIVLGVRRRNLLLNRPRSLLLNRN